ncbi:hypothetical protein [Oryza sativa Japonica Group]|uniref:Uncharacterized protein n=1 Tax=Oryza sativa subsp. japonica TaxID=39947 RepID=Q5VNY6_ORYSJ|nr:hypothetical protein [Oryza sativa Japonica Group]
MINIIKAAVTIAASTVGPPLVASCRRWKEDKRRGENKKVLVLLAERHSVWLGAASPFASLSDVLLAARPIRWRGIGEERRREDAGR